MQRDKCRTVLDLNSSHADDRVGMAALPITMHFSSAGLGALPRESASVLSTLPHKLQKSVPSGVSESLEIDIARTSGNRRFILPRARGSFSIPPGQ